MRRQLVRVLRCHPIGESRQSRTCKAGRRYRGRSSAMLRPQCRLQARRGGSFATRDVAGARRQADDPLYCPSEQQMVLDLWNPDGGCLRLGRSLLRRYSTAHRTRLGRPHNRCSRRRNRRCPCCHVLVPRRLPCTATRFRHRAGRGGRLIGTGPVGPGDKLSARVGTRCCGSRPGTARPPSCRRTRACGKANRAPVRIAHSEGAPRRATG